LDGLAKYQIFFNEITMEEFFYNFLNKYLPNIPPKTDAMDFIRVPVKRLEDLKLITLYGENQLHDSYFTTTEISHLIRIHFENKVKKHIF